MVLSYTKAVLVSPLILNLMEFDQCYLFNKTFYKVIVAKVRLCLEVKMIDMSKWKTLFMA